MRWLASGQASLGDIFLARLLHHLHPVQSLVARAAISAGVCFLVEVDGVNPQPQSGELVPRSGEEVGAGNILASLVHERISWGSESHWRADPLVTDGAIHMLPVWLCLVEIVDGPVVDA